MTLKRYSRLKFNNLLLILTLMCIILPRFVNAEYTAVKFPPKPLERDFISDQANMLDDAQESAIKQRLDKLLIDKAIPIIIVTINSLSEYDATGMRIELYARLLFDNWGIGYEKVKMQGNELNWNKGILLLINNGKRKARIELGADYDFEKNRASQQIMDKNIIPYFKKGDFAGGIASGAQALEQMARDEKIILPPPPAWHYLLIAVAIGLCIFTIVSLIKSGASGWAWLLWGFVFSIIGFLLYSFLTSRGRRSSSSGGGFSGGSFGGGFSGGGGATGSW